MTLNDDKWIDFFLSRCQNLTKPVVLKEQIDKSAILKFQDIVLDVFRNLSTIQQTKRMRIYLEDYGQTDAKMIVHNTPPNKGETIERWSERCFSNNRFGIILNSAQNYSDDLLKIIESLFSPLTERLGVPYGGFDITLFLGNYGFTPLGFHKDPIGHKVTHFHLGPGKKEMYLIDSSLYENELRNITLSIDGFKGCMAFNELIPHSIKYEIEAGDIFYMPNGYYHVGNSPDLSVAITIWHIEPTVRDIQNELNLKLIDKIFSSTNENLIKSGNPENYFEQVMNEIKPILSYEDNYADLPLKEILPLLLREHFMELESNSFFISKSYPKNIVFEPVKDQLFCRNEPFKIVFEKLDQENALIFIRGHRKIFPYHIGMVPFIKDLNEGKTLSIESMLETFGDEWEDEVTITFLKMLINYRVVNLIN